MKAVPVVAAVFRRGDAVLVTRRQDRPGRSGQWEFPGGKVEPGEAEPDALRREIREELACEVEVERLVLRHAHSYPNLVVDLAFYACSLPAGAEPRPVGVAEIAWVRAESLAGYDLLEADRAVLDEILRRS